MDYKNKVVKGVIVEYRSYDEDEDEDYSDLPPLLTQKEVRRLEKTKQREDVDLCPENCQCSCLCRTCYRRFCYRKYGDLIDRKKILGQCQFCLEDEEKGEEK
jgi:hypothetical protein